MDLFRFDELPDTIVLETRNAVEPGIDEAEAADLVVSKVRRLLYSRGFFRMRDLRLESTALPGDVYVPYWIGFRGRGRNANFSVLDAVRRRPEGAKVRQIVLNWLLTPGSQPVSPPEVHSAVEYFRNSRSSGIPGYPTRVPSPGFAASLPDHVACSVFACTRLGEMSTQIGRFEILSEIAKSARGGVFQGERPHETTKPLP